MRPALVRSQDSERLLAKGREHLVHFRLEAAERTFRELAGRPDGGIVAMYHLATSSFLKALVTDEGIYFDEFFSRSDTLLDVLDEQPASLWHTYLVAEAALQRAVAAAKQERFVQAALAGRTAYKHYERVVLQDASFYEPYKGLGLLHLMIGTLPEGFQRIFQVLGYRGSVSRGLEEMRLAADRSRLGWEEAQILVALIDIQLNVARDEGVERLRALQKRHPESALFNYLYGYALLETRRAEEAEQYLRRALEQGRRAEYFYIDYAEFYLAQALFRRNRFSEAEHHYRRYVRRHRGVALRATALLELGMALEMQGRRAEAVEVYRQVEAPRSYDNDRVAARRARRLAAAPMTPGERAMLLAANAYDAGRYREAEERLQAMLESPEIEDGIRRAAHFRLGRVYQAEGRFEEALAAYEAVEHQPTTEPWERWVPWSRLHRAEIYLQRGNTLKARRLISEALSYEGAYDYRQGLEQRAKVALERLAE